MSSRTTTLFSLSALLCIAIVTVSLSTPVRAQSPQGNDNENNCISCHENLYFLHDTGNWFCLRESPMLCGDCHGGDPEAVTKEMAHLQRAEHPVVNEDVSKCQECHPEECNERVELFNQVAGISQILVAAPYTPAYSTGETSTLSVNKAEEGAARYIMFWEIVPLVLVTAVALAIYFVARRRLNKKGMHS